MLDRFGKTIVSLLDTLQIMADESHYQAGVTEADTMQRALDGIPRNLYVAVSATPYDDNPPISGDSRD